MSEKSKDMCVDKQTVEEIVELRTKSLLSDLRGDYRVIITDLDYIKDQTTKTNSRVSNNEESLRELKNEGKTKELTCPFREDILNMRQQSAENKRIEELMEKMSMDRKEDNKLFYKKLHTWVVVITGVLALIMFGSEIGEFIYRLAD